MTINKNAKTSAGFKYAFNGLRVFFKTQLNAKIHLIAAVIVIACGFYYQISKTDWIALTFAIGLVLTTEALNTAIEFLTDKVSPEYSEEAKKVKDVAAGAVLISAITAVIIGLIVFL